LKRSSPEGDILPGRECLGAERPIQSIGTLAGVHPHAAEIRARGGPPLRLNIAVS
jgi:hypothetical protein